MDFFDFDDDYVRRLREHDREVEDHFSRYFRSLLFVMLRKRLPDADAIDDVIQETLVRVLARVGELRDGTKLGGFVLAVCRHVLQEWYRRRRTESLDEEHESIPGRSNAEAELLSNEVTRRVRQVLRDMPSRDADILRAVFLEEDDKDDICRRFNVDRKYLRVLLHRAKKLFKSLFR